MIFLSIKIRLPIIGWLVVIALLVIGIIVSCRGFKEQLSVSFTVPHQTSPSKQIVTNTLPLRELWRWSGHVKEGPSKILVKGEIIIVASSEEEGDKIIVLEVQTGKLVWNSMPTFENIQSLAVDNEQIYAGYREYVQAYDLESGQKLWLGAQQSKYKKGFLFVYSEGERVQVYDISSDWPHSKRLFLLHSQTGETIDTIEWPGIFFYDTKVVYSLEGPSVSGFNLIAQDRISKDAFWELPLRGYPQRWPVLIDNLMYIEAGELYALDKRTGKVLWESDATYSGPSETSIVNLLPENDRSSPIAYGAGLIYIVRNDAILVGLDARNGQKAGLISVKPLPVYQDEKGLSQQTHYLVAASDEFVAVYYDDSQELIVFERDTTINESRQ